MSEFADFEATRAYLYSLRNTGSRYGIERMQLLVDALGHPQRAFPCIHVAGTNGKGSVCAMLESVYRRTGLKVGMFTSPHLVDLGERIQVDRTPLAASSIAEQVAALRPVAERIAAEDPDAHPSFFEFMAAMAFLHFASSKVDIAILETGLGGRLDATNVVEPLLSIITSISLDHTEILGDTLAAIAREKAGIIKPSTPVLIGCLDPEAETEVRARAAACAAPVIALREHFKDDEALPATNLAGRFQRRNAGLAWLAVEQLQARFPVASERMISGLTQVQWAGRWQALECDGRRIILDATHNPEGVAMLGENLDQLIETDGCEPIIVAGALGTDRGRALVQLLAIKARELVFLRPNQPRALSADQLIAMLPDNPPPARAATVLELFPGATRCQLGQPGDTIVVTGSIYLIGEVLAQLQDRGDSTFQDLI